MDTWDWGYCAWDSLGFPQCVNYFPQYSEMGWNGHSLGFPQCVHYFSYGGTVGWDGHSSDSGECPKNIKTIWDSHCTIGHLLAMLDMIGVTFVVMRPSTMLALVETM